MISPCVSCLILSMKRSIDWATPGKLTAQPLAVELRRHRRVVLGGDVDDARHVADVAVVVRAVDHRNELVVRVLDVLVVLAVLVAVVRLAVQERDDERVLEPDVERVRAAVRPVRRRAPGDRGAATCCPCSRSGCLPARASPSRPPPITTAAVRCTRDVDRARSIRSLSERSMALSGQNPSAQSRRSAIRSGGIDCRNARPSSSSGGSKTASMLSPSMGRSGSSRASPPRGTARAGPSACACSRVASRRGGRRSPPSTGAAPSAGDRRALRRRRALDLRRAGSRGQWTGWCEYTPLAVLFRRRCARRSAAADSPYASARECSRGEFAGGRAGGACARRVG